MTAFDRLAGLADGVWISALVALGLASIADLLLRSRPALACGIRQVALAGCVWLSIAGLYDVVNRFSSLVSRLAFRAASLTLSSSSFCSSPLRSFVSSFLLVSSSSEFSGVCAPSLIS